MFFHVQLAPVEEAAKRLQAGGPSAPAAALDAVSRAATDSMNASLSRAGPSSAARPADSGFDPLRMKKTRAAPLQPLSEEERDKLVGSVSADQELAKVRLSGSCMPACPLLLLHPIADRME